MWLVQKCIGEIGPFSKLVGAITFIDQFNDATDYSEHRIQNWEN